MRAQISTYIIVGLVLLLGIALLFFVLRPSDESLSEIPADILPLTTFVEGCLEQQAENILMLLSLSGGTMLSNTTVETEFTAVHYGVDGIIQLPSLEEFGREASHLIDTNLPICLSSFPEIDLLTVKEPTTTIQFTDSTTQVLVKWPITLQKEKATTVEDFQVELDLAYKPLYETLRDILTTSAATPELMTLDADPYQLDVLFHDDKSYMYYIQDSTIGFISALRHNIIPARILGPSGFFAQTGVYFSEELEIDNPQQRVVSFIDDSAMFEVVDSRIEFIPSLPGEFTVNIQMSDEYGNIDEHALRFVIS